MTIPGPERLPRGFPEPVAPGHDVEDMVERALLGRPDLLRMSMQREAAAVERRLARNRRAPRIEVEAMVARDFGRVAPADAALLPTELIAGVTAELPLPLRQARGELRRTEAELGRIDAEARFLRDTIATEVRGAHAGLVAAHARVELARGQVEVGRALAAAERARFERGDSTLLFVNLREQAAADAEMLELEALAEYHRAAADLRAAVGGRSGS
jgi:outer membrane protein TolC